MRYAVLLLLATACDLQPPKRDVVAGSAMPAGPPPGVAIDALTASPPPPLPQPPIPAAELDAGMAAAVDAGMAAPADAMEVTAACTDVGVHIAKIVIDSIKDPAQKAALEQDRTKLVRRAAETCTRDAWNEAARGCFLRSKSAPELEACGRDLKAP